MTFEPGAFLSGVLAGLLSVAFGLLWRYARDLEGRDGWPSTWIIGAGAAIGVMTILDKVTR